MKTLRGWSPIIVVIALAVMLVAVACAPREFSAQFTANAYARDTIFSVEERGNGVTIVWLLHDDAGAYCVPENVASFVSLDKAMRSGQNVILNYRDLNSLQGGHPCKDAEPSYDGDGDVTGYYTYLVKGYEVE